MHRLSNVEKVLSYLHIPKEKISETIFDKPQFDTSKYENNVNFYLSVTNNRRNPENETETIKLFINNHVIKTLPKNVINQIDEVFQIYAKSYSAEKIGDNFTYSNIHRDQVPNLTRLIEINNTVSHALYDNDIELLDSENIYSKLRTRLLKRINGLKSCNETRQVKKDWLNVKYFDTYYQTEYDRESKYEEELKKNDGNLRDTVTNACQNITWSKNVTGTRDIIKEWSDVELENLIEKQYQEKMKELLKTASYNEDELKILKEIVIKDTRHNIENSFFRKGESHLGTFSDKMNLSETNIKQYVFGFRYNLMKYINLPQYFICMSMKSNDTSGGACDPLVEYTPHLNLLYDMCAYLSQADFVRFVLPKGILCPYKQRLRININDLHMKYQLIGVIRVPFYDNRIRARKHATSVFDIFLFYTPEQVTNFEYKYTNIQLFDSRRQFTHTGLLYNDHSMTYKEFLLFVRYLKVKTYVSVKHPDILFMTRKIFSDEYIKSIGLQKREYVFRAYQNQIINHDAPPEYHPVIIESSTSKDNIIQMYANADIYLSIDDPNQFIIDAFNYPQSYYPYTDDLQKQWRIKKIHSKISAITLKNTVGGASTVVFANIPIIIDEIASEYYDKFINNHKILAKLCNMNFQEFAEYISNFFDMEYIMPNNYQTAQTYSFVQTYDRTYKITNFLSGLEKKNSVILYRPFSSRFFIHYEILVKFDLLSRDEQQVKNILEYSNYTSFLECCLYFHQKYHSIQTKDNYYLKSNFKYLNHTTIKERDPNIIQSNINYSKQFINFSHDNSNHYLTMEDLTDSQKYDIIFFTLIYSDFNTRINSIFNLGLKLFGICFAIQNVKKGGDFILHMENITCKPLADIYILCKEYFNSVSLYEPETNITSKISFLYLVCKGRNDNMNKKYMNYMEEYFKNDPTLIGFNVEDQLMRKEYNIRPPVPSNFSFQYVQTFNTIKINDPIYQDIKDFNQYVYFKKYKFIEQLIKYKLDPNLEKIFEKKRQEQIAHSVLWAKQYDFALLPFEDKKNFTFDSKMSQLVLHDMFSYHQPIKFIFDNDYVGKNISSDKYIAQLHQLERELFLTDRLIDTRNINEWYSRKTEFRYYEPKWKSMWLKEIIEKKFNTGPISQAWLKMYEILNEYELFPTDITTLNTFHICEAPGNFIAAINHYAKTQTKINQFEWHANSLKPTEDKSRKTAFGDDYGYMKKYPKRWTFGADGTGDITHLENIIYYQKYTQNVDFITSDCGIPMTEGKTQLLKVHFAEILFMLLNLPVGKHFVAKLFVPQRYPMEVSIIYLLTLYFEHVSFFKGVINIHSKEFYIVCMGYKGISVELKKKLKDILNNFDPNNSLYETYPEDFLNQHVKIMNQFTSNYIFNFQRQLFYVDYYESLSEEHIKLVKKYIEKKNNDWIQKYKLTVIATKERL